MSVCQTSHFREFILEIYEKTKNINGGDRTHGYKLLKSSKKRFFLKNGYFKGKRPKSQKVMVGVNFVTKLKERFYWFFLVYGGSKMR